MTFSLKLMALGLIVGLTACAQAPIKTIRELPPAALAADCEHPAMRVSTNGQMAHTLLAYKQSLTMCNNDKAALREWMKE